ncbi:MAG TPA: glycosyltransferase family 2 protein [Caulobacteraceae bacterium]|nr:glycosyltransferase family 2 protein [Caulobacteraceae bacterium]
MSGPAPEISIVVPVFNEAGAAPSLAREIAAAFAGQAVEIIFIDDASDDGVGAALAALKSEIPCLRVIAHTGNAGQSRAIRTGVQAASAPIIVTLDGDGQNDPADAPVLVEALRAGPPRLGLVGGERTDRQDTASKRWASLAANAIRGALLADGAADTGCGLKAFRRAAFLALPYFDHLHRFLPAMMRREGYAIAFLPVSHRPRRHGASKYSNLGRAAAGIVDLAGVLWLKGRARDPGEIVES